LNFGKLSKFYSVFMYNWKIIEERKLRWFGHVLRIDNRTALGNTVGTERFTTTENQDDHERTGYIDVIKRDLRQMDLTWSPGKKPRNW